MENFTDKQWWFQELESIAKTQIRAIAVLRNLLQSYKEVSNSKATVVPEDWILVPREAGAEQEEAAGISVPSSIDSSSTEEEILASLEVLSKKFPDNYAVGEIPGVPLKINGEDWVLGRHPGLTDSYFLTRGTPESIKEARGLDWRN